jgi:hypothetical protein
MKHLKLNFSILSTANDFATDVKISHLNNKQVIYWSVAGKVKSYTLFWANLTISSQNVVDELSGRRHNVRIFSVLYKNKSCYFECDELKLQINSGYMKRQLSVQVKSSLIYIWDNLYSLL